MTTRPRTTTWPWIVMAVAGLVTFVASMTVGPDAVQGELSRIMYVHVPAAWLAYLAFIVTMAASAMYLWTRDLKWDRRASASAEIGVVFTGMAIGLGMIWAKPTWGVWWTWDARLTLTAIMFFVYLGYLALRRTTDDLAMPGARRSSGCSPSSRSPSSTSRSCGGEPSTSHRRSSNPSPSTWTRRCC